LAIFDLFVSYASPDRPWARKFFEDFRASYPSLRVFWDRESIPAGEAWRNELKSAIRSSKHLVVFWSNKANASLEVGPEIEAFNAHRDVAPQLEGSDRKGFYVPLEGERGGGIGDYQGFPDFKPIYQSQAEQRGIEALAAGAARESWERMIRMIGDAVSRADQAQRVIAAVAATMVDFVVEVLDKTRGKRPRGSISLTLDQFLAGFNLQWTDVRQRYGPSALDWRPTGDRTIVELLEGVRVRVNAKNKPDDHFQWKYVDMTTEEGVDVAENLHEQPAVVIFDPVSLYDEACANAMRRLTKYVRESQSVILSLSPALTRDDDIYALCVRDLSLPLFNDYFYPEIPPSGEFLARCAEVHREAQMERLVRHRIRDLRFAANKTASKATTGHA
jgi:hypothetical protein